MPHARHPSRPVIVSITYPRQEETSTATTGSSSNRVRFGSTTTSRPLDTREQWSFYNFETHAIHCDYCRDPAAVYRAGRTLCTEGNALCADVNMLVYSSNGECYARARDSTRLVRLEIPESYRRTRAALRVMEKQRLNRGLPYASPPLRRADSVMGDTSPARKSPSPRAEVVVTNSSRDTTRRHSARRTSPIETSSGRRSDERIRQEPERYHESDRRRSAGY